MTAAYGNPIRPYPTIYDLFALQVLCSAQGSVKQTQNPFIGWKSHRRGGESQPSQKPYYLLSATQAEPAIMRWLFMCLTMTIIPKNGEISRSVNRKGNNSRPKLRKPSHNNGLLEILHARKGLADWSLVPCTETKPPYSIWTKTFQSKQSLSFWKCYPQWHQPDKPQGELKKCGAWEMKIITEWDMKLLTEKN